MAHHSLGYLAGTGDSRAFGVVDFHVADDIGMHREGLGHRHTRGPANSGQGDHALAGVGHRRNASSRPGEQH